MRIALLMLMLVALLGAPATPRAQPVPAAGAALLDLDVTVGFAGTFRLGRWTPVSVTVRNRGRDRSAEVQVQVRAGNALRDTLHTTVRLQQVDLPRDSRKRLHFTVPLESLSEPLLVRVVADGRELARREVDLRRAFSDARLLLVLSRDANLDLLNDSDGRSLRVLYPLPEALPHQWQGYQGVDALLVHGVSLQRLEVPQYRALELWLQQGGTLLVGGGPDLGVLRTPRLAALLPGVPDGLLRLADGAALGSALGSPVHAPRPFEVNRVSRFEGRVSHGLVGLPLVLEVGRGAGRVVFLGFDISRYPFDAWAGLQELLLEVLRLPPLQPVSLDQELAVASTSVVPSVVRDPGLDYPDHVVVLLFVLLYLGVLATGQQLGPRAARLRPWLSWAAPLVFVPAAWWLFSVVLFPTGSTAVLVATLRPIADTPLARLGVEVGLFDNQGQASGGGGRAGLTLAYDGARPTLRPQLEGAPPAQRAWRLTEAPRRRLQPPGDAALGLHRLRGEDIVEFDLRASAEQTDDALRLGLDNASGQVLGPAWLLFDGRVHALGSIGAAARLTLPVATDSGAALAGLDWRVLLHEPGEPGTIGLAGARIELLRREAEAAPRDDQALLLAFTAAPLRLAVGPGWRYREVTLLSMRVPVRPRLPAARPEPGGIGAEDGARAGPF